MRCAANRGKAERTSVASGHGVAAEQWDVEGVKRRGDAGDDTDTRGARMVKMLLEHGARSNVTTRDGLSPLHLAAREGNLESCRLLYEAHPAAALG